MQATFQKITNPSEASFRCFERQDDGFGFEWHYHPECELTLILESAGKRFVGDSISDYGSGDLVLIGPSLPHTWCSDPARGPEQRSHRAVVIQFDRGLWGGVIGRMPELQSIEQLLDRSRRGLSFTGAPAREAAKIIGNMPMTNPTERLIDLLRVLSGLARSSRVESLASPGFVPSLRRSDQQRIDLVCGYLNEYFTTRLEQAEVARQLRMNPASFCRFFKQATGKTMTAYVNELRVARACRLLIETDLSVLEICYEVGFGNLSNFTRQFRKVKSTSPGRFRNAFLASARAEKA